MAMSFKERMAAKKAGSGNGGGSSIRDKFKRRQSDTLENAYKEKDKRTSGSGGANIFNMELLNELGLDIFKPDMKNGGAYFNEILPPSFDPSVPYFIEIAVHEMVGVDNSQFLCLKRINESTKSILTTDTNCYRCKVQKELYQKHGSATKEITALYPKDKVVYLIWERSEELGKEQPPKIKLSVWCCPKASVHAEIQKGVRDKISKKILDISDLSPDGQGRTVYFDVEIKDVKDKDSGSIKKMPQYGGFDLIERESPIPDEIIELLDNVIQELEKRMTKGMRNPLEVLLHIPSNDEIKEAMSSEVNSGDEKEPEKSEEKSNGSRKPMTALERIKAKKEKEKKSETIDFDELEKFLNDKDEEGVIEWAEEKNLIDVLNEDMDKDTMIIALLEHLAKVNDDIPF